MPDSAHALFQPIVDVHRTTVVGFEALTRFTDGASALEHLHRAQQEGRRERLELHLIDLAIAAAAQLPRGGFVTLNLSGRTMRSTELPTLLSRGDHRWGLELFEGTPAQECATAREEADRMGALLLIDDAGAGFADDRRILDLRPDIVKIDRALFWQSLTQDDARRVVHGMLGAAREVGARTLVEGVEDAAQLDAVRELGAELAQGYHLGRPTPAHRMADLLGELQRRVGVDAAGL